MAQYDFGNNPQKLDRYRAFWERRNVERPLVGFTQIGWFPLQGFSATEQWLDYRYLEPAMVAPEHVVPDHVKMIEEGGVIEDDLIRGVGPMQVAVPFIQGILGSKMRILPENILGEEQNTTWEAAMAASIETDDPWFRAYVDLVSALVDESDGRFPVSHGAEIGPSDMHAILKGHFQSINDLIEEPEKSARLLSHFGEIFVKLTKEAWKRIPKFHGGYFDAQYSLWAPGPIARMQEDASAVYSPDIYRSVLQPVDRYIAQHFPCCFLHLHSTSMFLLEAFLEIHEIKCFEINNDAAGPPLDQMIPYFKLVQQAGRSLIIRGSFTKEELDSLTSALDSRGLFLLVMVQDLSEIEPLRRVITSNAGEKDRT